MNKEIKEKMTIGKAKKILRGFLEKDCYYDTPLYYAIPYLLDYITNLEQAVKNTKETADDMLYELNEEKEELKSRIEKAVEYIENTPLYETTYDYNMEEELEIQNVSDETASNKLLNILKGKGD